MRTSINMKGTSLLEMLIFTPLALMILFLGIDSALRFVEMAGVNDAMRSALKAELENLNSSELFELNLDGTMTIDENNLSLATQAVAQRIRQQIEQAKASLPTAPREDYFIEVTPLSVPVQVTQGRLITNAISIYNSVSFNRSSQAEILPSDVSGLLDNSQTDSNLPSNYSVTIGPQYAGENTELRYMDTALFLFVRVQGQTSGISPDANLGTGEFFEVDETQLIPLRTISK